MRIDYLGVIVIRYIVGLYEVIWKYRDNGEEQWKLQIFMMGMNRKLSSLVMS